MTNENKITIYRQGDVIVIPVDENSLNELKDVFGEDFTKWIRDYVKCLEEENVYFSKKVVIAGEEHLHSLTGDYIATRIGEDMYVVRVREVAVLEHPEHGQVKLARGFYFISRIADAVRKGDNVAVRIGERLSELTSSRAFTRGYD